MPRHRLDHAVPRTLSDQATPDVDDVSIGVRAHDDGVSKVLSVDEYQQRLDQRETAWTELARADARQHAVWADGLGDLLEAGCLIQADAARVVAWLVQGAMSDSS